jgi:GDPmannose 4,6-dehydratase
LNKQFSLDDKIDEIKCFDYNIKIGAEVVKVDSRYYRPTEVDLLIGDPTKAHLKLGWKPKYTLGTMIKEMMEVDISESKKKKAMSGL